MPITKSAKKSLRVSLRKQRQNLGYKLALKKALEKPKPAELIKIQSLIDKAAKKGIIHKNKAARLKSKLFKSSKGKVQSSKLQRKTQK